MSLLLKRVIYLSYSGEIALSSLILVFIPFCFAYFFVPDF